MPRSHFNHQEGKIDAFQRLTVVGAQGSEKTSIVGIAVLMLLKKIHILMKKMSLDLVV